MMFNNMPNILPQTEISGIHTYLTLTFSVKETKDFYCVYEQAFPETPNAPFYIGMCRLQEVYVFPDAKNIDIWSKMITEKPVIQHTIVFVSINKIECQNHRFRLIKNKSPYVNINGKSTQKDFGQIYCNETRETFNSIQEIINIYGGAASAYSMHLRELPGHKTVKGKTFRRI